MSPFLLFILFVLGFGLFVLILRWVGAWMLRIDVVISLQKEILEEIKKISAK
ncbi:MAG: hypothetical protein HN691_14210 [Bacteroidetes bacterium]|jgi:hypothetical protein|nr:hypothetical protein [Bacteroidota bacterium]